MAAIELASKTSSGGADVSATRDGGDLGNRSQADMRAPRLDPETIRAEAEAAVATELGRDGSDWDSSPEARRAAHEQAEADAIGRESVILRDSQGREAEEVAYAESRIYSDAGLEAKQVNGRECLVRNEVDWAARGADGISNLERAGVGQSPLDRSGNPYELHHVGQKHEGRLAELRRDEHRGSGNDGVLHASKGPSEIDRAAFTRERADHWKARAAEVRAQMAGGN